MPSSYLSSDPPTQPLLSQQSIWFWEFDGNLSKVNSVEYGYFIFHRFITCWLLKLLNWYLRDARNSSDLVMFNCGKKNCLGLNTIWSRGTLKFLMFFEFECYLAEFLCQTILCQVFNKLTWDYLQTITVWILGNFSQNLLLISENSLTITLHKQLVQNSFEILFIDGVDPLDCCFLQWVLSVRLQWLCWSRLRLYTAYSYSALLQQLQYSVSTLRPNCAASSTLHCLPCSWVRAESFCSACTGLAFPFLSSMFLLLWLACCWEHSDYNQQWIPRKINPCAICNIQLQI